MAVYNCFLCSFCLTNLALILLFAILKGPYILLTTADNGHLDQVAGCYADENSSSWHPEWEYIKSLNGTDVTPVQCFALCPVHCICSLGNFSEVILNCTNGNISVIPVSYPVNVVFLSWARSSLLSVTQDAFEGLADTLQTLHLNGNSLRLRPGVFLKLVNLQALDLQHNRLKEIPAGTFEGLAYLQWLDLRSNLLKEVKPDWFRGLAYLSGIYLSKNLLETIQSGSFGTLTYLYYLDLSSNVLKELKAGAFGGMTYLQYLYLDGNMLQEIEPEAFRNLSRYLYVLNLSNNKLVNVHPDTFLNLRYLDSLELCNTSLHFLPEGIFYDLWQLEHLDLSQNNLMALQHRPFQNFIHLNILNLTGNPLWWIKKEAFNDLNETSNVFVDNYASCCFIDEAMCYSNPPDPFLTCKRLLPYSVLRVGIWIVSILAIVNNLQSLFINCSRKQQTNKVQFLLITNLSVSDFLMGVYLISLLSADLYYTDYFPSHSWSWRNSALCNFAGSLSVLSSEASVFFVTLISIDRFMRVKFPFGKLQLGTISAKIIITSLWFVAFVISITSFLLSWKGSDVYAVSEICVGLPISRQNYFTANKTSVFLVESLIDENLVYNYKATSSHVTMYFSIAIFTVLNLVCFCIVGFCYTAIFILIWQSSKRSGLSVSRTEIRISKKMFLLVLTDFCCWVPIGVLSILVQAGAVEVDPVAYAWIATFILPINSSINPFLYTLGDAIADKVSCSCNSSKAQNRENIVLRTLNRFTKGATPHTIQSPTGTTPIVLSRDRGNVTCDF